MPCVTAFSTSGCNSSGGTKQPPASGAQLGAQAIPSMPRSMARNRSSNASSAPP